MLPESKQFRADGATSQIHQGSWFVLFLLLSHPLPTAFISGSKIVAWSSAIISIFQPAGRRDNTPVSENISWKSYLPFPSSSHGQERGHMASHISKRDWEMLS